jgi:signal transduction histidine kinase
VILPVEREGKLLGMAIGVTTGIELLERSFSRLRPFGINASIYDLDADPASSLLAFHKSRRSRKARTPEWNMPRPAQRGEHSLQVEWGKRKWLIECAPIAELRLDRPSWGIVGLTGAGWMITVLTANLLRRGEAQRARVEMLVQERTRELQEARDIALEASKMKSQLVANVSHELRTPLNGILGAQSLLAESTLNEEQREYSETIRTCGRGLLSLVEDLLDASRMESGSAALRDEEYNVRGLLAECSAIARLEAATRDLEWKLELGDDLPEWTRGDARRVRQILLNLVTNAIKFTENGEVALAAEREGEWLRFQVRDTGCGIPDSEKGRLFGRFVQVDASKKRRQSGVGLGLSITKGFVEQMGGQIGFESKAGQGSTFWVRIPYREAAGRVSVAKNLEWTWGAAGELNGAEVLVAEDNRVNQTLAKQMLERMGCKVSIAADGREACNMAAAKRFDVD